MVVIMIDCVQCVTKNETRYQVVSYQGMKAWLINSKIVKFKIMSLTHLFDV